jgi:ferredoxin
MPQITFKSKELTVHVSSGCEFLELYRKNPHLPLKFGCTRGECGVCAIKIADGKHNLSKCSKFETQTLQKKGLDSSSRLACQCAINGDIVVE